MSLLEPEVTAPVRARPRVGSRALAIAAVVVVAVLALALLPLSGTASSANVTVNVTVTSHISLTNNCVAPTAVNFGTVLPGSTAVGETSPASACSFTFQSNNDSSMLRISQADGIGTALTAGDGSGWTTAKPSTTATMSVSMGNASTIFASFGDGTIRRSADSGATWPLEATGQTDPVNDVDAFDGTTAFAVGGSSFWTTHFALRRTGSTWTAGTIPGTVTHSLNAVSALSATVAWAVGEGGEVIKTGDGGVTWTKVTVPGVTETLYGVDTVSGGVCAPTCVYISTQGGFLVRSLDAGATWTKLSMPVASDMRDVYAINGTTVLVSGTAKLYRATNANAGVPTWTDVSPVSGDFITGISSSDGTNVFISTWFGWVYRSTTGGTIGSWTSKLVGNGSLTEDVAANGANASFTAGWNSTIYGSSSWSTFTPANLVDGTVMAMDGVADTRVWVVETDGRIWTTTNQGGSWSAQASGTTSLLTDVDAVDQNTAWASGWNGTVLRTTDGATWNPVPPASITAWSGIAATSASSAWVVGNVGESWRTSNGGASWTQLNLGTANDLTDIAMYDATTGWAVGKAGTIRKTTDGGSTWTVQDFGAGELDSIAISSPQVALVSGRGGVLLRTTNGGTTWTVLPTGTTDDLIDVSAASSNDILVNGGNQHRSVSHDAGQTWTTTTSIFQGTGAYMADANTMYAGSPDSGIYRRAPGGSIPDYNPLAAGPNWGTAASTGFFGACLQDIGASTVAGTWLKDTTGGPRCTASDSDPWYAIPIAPTKIAYVTTVGATGRADVVFGARIPSGQAPGTYRANVTFEALAPNV